MSRGRPLDDLGPTNCVITSASCEIVYSGNFYGSTLNHVRGLAMFLTGLIASMYSLNKCSLSAHVRWRLIVLEVSCESLTRGVISLERYRGRQVHWRHFDQKWGYLITLSPLYLPSLSRPFLFHFPLSFPFHATHIQLIVWERCEVPQWGLGRNPADIEFGAIWQSNTGMASGDSNFCDKLCLWYSEFMT